MEEQKKGPVCVTGGTGYIASWLVMRLLQKGYIVRTTVRPDPECKRDISYLTSLPRASENLQILNADLDNPDSFNAAIEGCIGVFHLAHPMPHKEALDEESVTRKAVEGALGILKACVNSKTVKRVVHTSGSAAAAFSGSNQDIVDESAWSDVEFHRSLKVYGTSHVAAKTKTEQAALQFAEENGLEIVTLVPPLVVGGFITNSFPGSVYLALSMILGKDHYKHLISSSMVHIDDLVSAHIFLFENPNAKGRYICSSNQISLEELSQFLSAKYPEFQIPTIESLKGIEGYKRCGFSSQKLLSSGFKFKHGLDDMFDDAIQSCKEKGFL